MSTELALDIEITNPIAVFSTESGIDPVIDEARKIVAEFNGDTSTTKGRQEIASIAHKISKLKTRLDGMGKELTAEWKAKSKLVDQSRRHMRTELDALKVQVRAPLTEWEEAEKQRTENHERTVERIKTLGADREDGTSPTLEELQANLAELQAIDTDSMEEYELEGRKTRDKMVERLNNLIESEQKRLQQEAELKQLQEEKAERERQEMEQRIKEEAAAEATREAEEKAKAEQERLEREKQEAIEREAKAKREAEEAEQQRIEAEKQAERDRIAAEERAKLEAEQAEKEKQEAVARAKQEEIDRQNAEKEREEEERKKREANKRHIGKLRKEAKEALMELEIDEPTAVKIILAIDKAKIPHISIQY